MRKKLKTLSVTGIHFMNYNNQHVIVFETTDPHKDYVVSVKVLKLILGRIHEYAGESDEAKRHGRLSIIYGTVVKAVNYVKRRLHFRK